MRATAFELVRGEPAAGAGRELMWWRNGTLPAPDEFDAFLMAGDRIWLVFARD
jgi:hypothetical protein